MIKLIIIMQCIAVCCSVLQCVTVCCSALQCVAVCCRVLSRAIPHITLLTHRPAVLNDKIIDDIIIGRCL